MKYLPLIIANLFRKKIRTVLTIGSFAVALFLFGLLAVVRGAFHQGVDVAGADRLVVVNRVSIIQPLPVSYKEQLQALPKVKAVTYSSWFGGIYQDEKNFFAIFAIDRDTYRSVFPEFVISDEHWRAFGDDREGAIVGEGLARRFGWKVGDRIPIKGTIFPGTWEFNIRGIYHGTRTQDDLNQFWFRGDYFDERKPFQKGTVGWYAVRVDSPDDSVSVSRKVDQMYANSAWETKTETESSFAASWVKQMGNIELLILTIGTVVFFTLMLVTGNTMAISVRERIRELATLKAVGFSDTFVLSLIVAESLLIASLGGAVGLALAKAFTLRGDPTGGLLPFFYLAPNAMAAGFAMALVVGMIAGLAPALSAARLRVVDALRSV
jgi:putative ABC transport system permease protein